VYLVKVYLDQSQNLSLYEEGFFMLAGVLSLLLTSSPVFIPIGPFSKKIYKSRKQHAIQRSLSIVRKWETVVARHHQ
jgi:hypothetical protein